MDLDEIPRYFHKCYCTLKCTHLDGNYGSNCFYDKKINEYPNKLIFDNFTLLKNINEKLSSNQVVSHNTGAIFWIKECQSDAIIELYFMGIDNKLKQKALYSPSFSFHNALIYEDNNKLILLRRGDDFGLITKGYFEAVRNKLRKLDINFRSMYK